MNRRDALKRTSLLLGYAVSASTVAAVMAGCKADPKVLENGLANWTPESMTKDQGQLLAHLAEVVIPKTDTGGAIDAGVHSYLDMVLKNTASEEEKGGFKMWIEDLAKRSNDEIGKSFVDASKEERNSFMKAYETAAIEAGKTQTLPLSIWFLVKEQILTGYFTSEVGQTEALEFLPIPGEYIACMPLDEVSAAWGE